MSKTSPLFQVIASSVDVRFLLEVIWDRCIEIATKEDNGLSTLGVVVLGTPGLLRNPSLESVHPNVRFIPPVYFPANVKPSINQLFREFLLNGTPLIRGERGCSQAHINIRTDILSSNENWTLVLEDDVGMPSDWFTKVCSFLPGFPESFAPGVILLNTNPHFNLGTGLIELSLLPSGSNAFLVHRDALVGRSFTQLENLERADWPISFSRVRFWSIGDIAFCLPTESEIGLRKTKRVSFLLSSFIRAIFSPLSSRILGLPLRSYLFWSVLGPIKRDIALRLMR